MNNLALNMLAKAVIRKVVDTLGRQTAQVEVTKGELIDDMERMQSYGVTSNPPVAGSDAYVAFLGGSREQGIILAIENRQLRVKGLETGEVAIYDDLGNVIKLGRESVDVVAMLKLTATAPEIVATTEMATVSASSRALISSGGSSVSITPAAVEIISPILTHNGKNIGNTHYHVGSPASAIPV